MRPVTMVGRTFFVAVMGLLAAVVDWLWRASVLCKNHLMSGLPGPPLLLLGGLRTGGTH